MYKTRYFQAVLALLLIVSVGTALSPSSAQPNPECDPALKPSPDSRWPYTQRDHRCEGVFERQVNATSLTVAGLGEPSEGGGSDPLLLHWSASSTGPVRVRATPLIPGTDYRMDARVESGHQFRWPLDVLHQVGLEAKDVGIAAWTESSDVAAGPGNRIYYPVRLAESPAGDEVELVVVLGREMEEIYVTLMRIDEQGHQVGDPLMDGEPLEYGQYPPRQPTFIYLTPPEPGLYEVGLGAEVRGGGLDTNEIVFSHGGP